MNKERERLAILCMGEALQHPAEERSAYIEQFCGDNGALLETVRELLEYAQTEAARRIEEDLDQLLSPEREALRATTQLERTGSTAGPLQDSRPVGQRRHGDRLSSRRRTERPHRCA